MARRKFKDVTFNWEEGRYFDLWMVVHLLGGATLALFFLLIGIGRFPGYLLVFFITIGWEAIEYLGGIAREHEENRVIDVVMGVIGFGLMYESMMEVSYTAYPSIFILSILMFILLTFIGFLDSIHRKGLK